MRGIAFTPDGRRALSPWDDGLAVFDAISTRRWRRFRSTPPRRGSLEPWWCCRCRRSRRPTSSRHRSSATASRCSGAHHRGGRANQLRGGGRYHTGKRPPPCRPGAHCPFTPSSHRAVCSTSVRALSGGVPGQPSNEIRIAVNPALPPSAPEGLVGLVNGSSVALAWRNTNAGGWPTSTVLDVTGSLNTQLVLPPGESFTFNDVPPGTYTLAVRSANTYGSSAPSNSVTLTFPGACSGAPLAPSTCASTRPASACSSTGIPRTGGPAPTFYVLRVTGSFTGAFQTTDRTLSGTVGPGIYLIGLAAANVLRARPQLRCPDRCRAVDGASDSSSSVCMLAVRSETAERSGRWVASRASVSGALCLSATRMRPKPQILPRSKSTATPAGAARRRARSRPRSRPSASSSRSASPPA